MACIAPRCLEESGRGHLVVFKLLVSSASLALLSGWHWLTGYCCRWWSASVVYMIPVWQSLTCFGHGKPVLRVIL